MIYDLDIIGLKDLEYLDSIYYLSKKQNLVAWKIYFVVTLY